MLDFNKIDIAADLIIRYLIHDLNSEQKLKLDEWRNDSIHNETFFNYITDPGNLKESILLYRKADRNDIWQLIRQKLPQLPEVP